MHARICLSANLWFAATVMALGAFAMPRAHAADLEQLAKRVQVLEDREEIRALILAYGQAHDHRDYKMFASLFATNGEWIGGLGTAKGPDAIFALMDKSIGHHPLPEGSGTIHVLTNDQIVIDGDRASVRDEVAIPHAGRRQGAEGHVPRALRRSVHSRERPLEVLAASVGLRHLAAAQIARRTVPAAADGHRRC